LVALAVAAMVGAGVVGAVISRQLDDDQLPPQRASGASLDVAEARDNLPRIDVADVAAHVAPSVVTISADLDAAEEQFGQSVGTGVIITSDGEILTNAHVVENAIEVRVRLAGESEPRRATVLANDIGNDLALLRIAGDDFVPATFAAPGSIRIGDEVVAIGFALDLDGDPSVTLGIVSATDRTIVSGDAFLDGLIQTDAAISSGNSGGPLVNAAGEVVGINTAVARGDFQTAASNIGFAISVDEALPIVEQLRAQADGAQREDGYLGVRLDERTDGGQGAIVVSVEPDTPAAEAGIAADDIVIEVDGTPINGGAGLVAAIRDREPGDTISITVLREGELLELEATLVVRPEA
jgi:putative serine protease PepD